MAIHEHVMERWTEVALVGFGIDRASRETFERLPKGHGMKHDMGETLRPTIFYRATCPRRRVISRLLLLISLGSLRRVPLGSREARAEIERPRSR
jgi:hypothetical protein